MIMLWARNTDQKKLVESRNHTEIEVAESRRVEKMRKCLLFDPALIDPQTHGRLLKDTAEVTF